MPAARPKSPRLVARFSVRLRQEGGSLSLTVPRYIVRNWKLELGDRLIVRSTDEGVLLYPRYFLPYVEGSPLRTGGPAHSLAMQDTLRYRGPVELDAWKAQLRKGAAELAVLATLAQREAYGLDLLERIHVAGGLELSEGSIYPLLNRLQKEGKIRGRWVQDADATHPRKYYGLTRDGRAVLAEMLAEWAQFEAAMRQILGEEVARNFA